MTTFYGYVIDLAFRTNEAANLQLQSDAVNRIYTDGGSSTAGSGSKAILNYAEGMTETQIKNMLNGVRVVFFDPESGTIYGRAKLGTPEINSDTKTATATLYLMDDSGSTKIAANATLTALEVATPKKISALVYLDGTSIDNMSVKNAANSGTLLLNLQFSSSADLKPMEDSEIKNAG
jgi:predicted RNA-binding protein